MSNRVRNLQNDTDEYQPLTSGTSDYESANSEAIHEKSQGGTASSLMTIFSVWNTMMGSGLLTLPWGFAEAGLLGGIAVIVLVGLVAWYTCWLVLKYGTQFGEFMDMTRHHFGKVGEVIAWAASIFLFTGALAGYHILMSDSLYSNVETFRQMAYTGPGTVPDVPYWSHIVAAAAIVLITFPITNLKTLGVMVKFNSFGIISVAYIVGFILYDAIFVKGLLNTTGLPYPDTFFLRPKFYYLGGIMSIAFFIHTAIISIMKNNRYQENNSRDLFIAFTLVAVSFIVVGAFGYSAYWRNEIPQDYLENFAGANVGAIIGRFALLFQLITVYPILAMIIRIQFFSLLWKKDYPGWLHVLILNTGLMAITTVFAMFYPQIGTVLRFTGPGIGLLLVFLIPIGVRLKMLYSDEGYLPYLKTCTHIFLMLLGIALLVAQFV